MESLEQEILNLKRSKAGFQPLPLPEGIPTTSNDVIASLNEHLLQALSTLHQREKEVGVAQEALEKFQRKFSVIIHQQVHVVIVHRPSEVHVVIVTIHQQVHVVIVHHPSTGTCCYSNHTSIGTCCYSTSSINRYMLL